MKRTASALVLAVALTAALAACTKNSSNESSSSSTAAPAGNAMAAGDVAHGKVIYTQNCASCHGASGVEGGVGPSLKDEKSRKNMEAAVAWIKNPQPPMPKLYPSPLSEKDVTDVAAYVETL